MLENFVLGFLTVVRILLLIAGGLCAVLAAAVLVCLVLLVAAALFDRITRWITKRIRKKGRKPRNRIESILLGDPREV